ncbi:MAG: ROK family protein [Bacteroidetes bacterium]|nr:ROK family protein [Bacteroidota bacterium]
MTTLGVDLGGTNIRAGVRVDDSITQRAETVLKDQHSYDGTLGQLIDLIRSLMSAEVKGIGIAVPSIVDSERGIVYDVVNIPSWKEVGLKHILEDAFGVPVGVDNDANCFAWGEWQFGMAKGHRHAVGITLGTGVGSGVIINSKIYRGANGGAGEIGYLPYKDRDFEFYGASFYFKEVHKSSALEQAQKAEQGDTHALKIWDTFGIHIGDLVKAVTYAFDPEVIVFGGSISNAFHLFEPSMKRTLSSQFYFPGSMSRLKIFKSENKNITLLGASALILPS